MKQIALVLAPAAFIMVLLGCDGKKYDSSGEQSKLGAAPAMAASEANSPPGKVSAYANGGSALPASMPYAQSGAPAVSQNLNPSPFLSAAGAPVSNVFVSTEQLGLTSRADGTMFGPNDQPAAGIGAGMTVAVPGRQGGKVPAKKK
jgi:hypothetical protein